MVLTVTYQSSGEGEHTAKPVLTFKPRELLFFFFTFIFFTYPFSSLSFHAHWPLLDDYAELSNFYWVAEPNRANVTRAVESPHFPRNERQSWRFHRILKTVNLIGFHCYRIRFRTIFERNGHYRLKIEVGGLTESSTINNRIKPTIRKWQWHTSFPLRPWK